MKKLTLRLTRITNRSFRPPIAYARRPGMHFPPTPSVTTASISQLTVNVGPSGLQTIEFQQLAITETPDLFP